MNGRAVIGAPVAENQGAKCAGGRLAAAKDQADGRPWFWRNLHAEGVVRNLCEVQSVHQDSKSSLLQIQKVQQTCYLLQHFRDNKSKRTD